MPSKLPVKEYLEKLRMAKKSPVTIKGYGKVFKSLAAFLGVPCEDLHNHLSSDALAKYAYSQVEERKLLSSSVQQNIRVLSRYFKFNGIEIDTLDLEIIKNPGIQNDDEDEPEGKPLTREILARMMDQGNVHSRSIISFLVSTGCRAGEASKLLLSSIGKLENGKFIPDISGTVIKIPDSIAKGKVKNGKKTGGGITFLNQEAREYLDAWLAERDEYVKWADEMVKKLPERSRPVDDQRIFCVSYGALYQIFHGLYRKADPSDNKRSQTQFHITPHATRAFFRTHAVKTMSLDAVEKIMRHKGYLTENYVKIDDLENQYRDGEAELYITRADHRIQGSKLDKLDRENKELRERLQRIENRDKAITTLDTIQLSDSDRDAIAKKIIALQKELEKQ